MILSKLELKNFRNYDRLEINFDKNINIFIGNNAQGKTNVLEAIYVLSLTKSHRCNKDFYLIKENSLFTKVKGELINNDKKTTYEILINKEGKRVSINNRVVKKISNYISHINAIMFCPDDLEILKGSPNKRRTFLNIELGQFNNNYIRILNEYNKILKNRNEYLREYNFDKAYFDILTEKLIDKNIEIYNYRKEFINNINKYINKIFKNISREGNIKVIYESFMSDLNEKNKKEKLIEKYNRVYDSELFQKTTLIGIHRDDFSIYINKIKINNYGSQGQHRIAILCFKLAEIEIYKSIDKNPILLLDDIFSELDKNKKNNIIKYIENDLQVFITTTDLSNIDKKLKKQAYIYKVNSGKITRGE